MTEKGHLQINRNVIRNLTDLHADLLYGILLLRLQKKEISQGTAKAIEAISSFLSLLANYYDKERKGELKLDND